jgi:hypothetical protein
MALNDFDYIKAKVRRVTGRPSINQLTDAELIDYINSFLVYDFPLHTRDFYNRQTYSFQLTPNVAVYSIQAIKNNYSNFEPPLYVDGFLSQYHQNEQGFYSLYPRMKYSTNFSVGTGVLGTLYNGTYQYTPVDAGTCIISAQDLAGNVLTATDVRNPANASLGGFVDQTGVAIAGSQIVYATGVITGITFTAAVPLGSTIYISANNYVKARPFAMLYYNNEFRFWPYPDRSYTVQLVAWLNPLATTATGGALFPELIQWGDVIAYGASLKILADNLDLESYGKVKLLFDEAKRLAERRTMKQLSTQRVATIYDDGMGYPAGGFGYPS